ncbi:hypothetical protein [Microbacterium sp. GXF0217]
MATFKLVGGPNDGEWVDALPDGYVALGTDSISSEDPSADIPQTAEYEG